MSQLKQEGFLLGALLNIPTELLNQHILEGLRAEGFADLRPSHTQVFQRLSLEGDRVVELAEQTHITKQSMGYLIDYLEKHGYVERIPDPTDRRAQLVRRTERGWQVNHAAARLVQQLQQEWTTLLGEAQMQQLEALLTR
jgi:DNA-binding MarR family transcriptional regulator